MKAAPALVLNASPARDNVVFSKRSHRAPFPSAAMKALAGKPNAVMLGLVVPGRALSW